MRLIGRERLSRLQGSGEQINKWLLSWAAEVAAAQWKYPVDVCAQFPSALHRGEGRFIFPVRNSSVAIDLLVAFPQGIALITDLKVEQ